MATTKRNQILNALLLRLLPINTAATRNHVRLLDSKLPALTLWDDTESSQPAKYGKQSHRLAVHVVIADYLLPDANPSEVGNELLGQLIKAVIGTDPSLSGLAESVRHQSNQISYPEAGGDWIIGVEIIFEVAYETVLGDPYN